ncbi:YhcN/YlaJ family sporulation lipoprotein [Bacillus sp. Bva_UNVM-123]|uniref:YhcN/YlaJ family sporulation lipoprotein n=1 Tax=Bacillus sp. Bva_UNVM-123 TaxID=2829798 RepID=UPI00391F4121
MFFIKKSLIIFSICGLAALTACQNHMANEGPYQKSGNTINVNNERADIYNRNNGNNKSENYGYVRHQRSPIMGENMAYEQYAAIDREQLADIISKNCTNVPHVDDISTLVTDKEVLVIYHTDSDNRTHTAEQVKKMAMSVVPRWFHIYVSDNTNLRKNVENYATVNSNSANSRYGLDKLINEMKKSSQGER